MDKHTVRMVVNGTAHERSVEPHGTEFEGRTYLEF